MERVRSIVALVYFGRLPDHFQLWLNSCGRNPEIDWIVLTDDPGTYRWPDNVTRHAMTFAEMKDRLGRHVDVSNLVIPYKLCDFKPLYGLALEDIFAGYDAWGYCDADMIFGRIPDFATPEVLRSHAKVFKRGHLSLMRNSEEVRRIWSRAPDRPDAVTIAQAVATPATVAFDESAGVYRNYLAAGLPVFVDEVALDISAASYRMRATKFLSMLDREHQAFYWQDGRLVQRYLDDGLEVAEREFCYIHFKRRRMAMRVAPDARAFWIGPGGFEPLERLPTTPGEFAALNGPSLAGDAAIRLRHLRRRVGRVLARQR